MLRILLYFIIYSAVAQEKDATIVIVGPSGSNSIFYAFNSEGDVQHIKTVDQKGNEVSEISFLYKQHLVSEITITKSKKAFQKRVLSYDVEGKLSRVDTLGETTSFLYNDIGQLQYIRNFDGHTIELRYNDAGQLTSQTKEPIDSIMKGYIEIKNISYQADKVTDTTYYTSPYGEKVCVTVREFTNRKLTSKYRYWADNPLAPTAVVHYSYGSTGILSDKETACGIQTFEVLKNENGLDEHSIKKINRLLVGDFGSIFWYWVEPFFE